MGASLITSCVHFQDAPKYLVRYKFQWLQQTMCGGEKTLPVSAWYTVEA